MLGKTLALVLGFGVGHVIAILVTNNDDPWNDGFGW